MDAPPLRAVNPVQPRNEGRSMGLSDLIWIVAGVAVWLVIVRNYGQTMRLGPGWYMDLWSLRKLRLNRHGLALFGFGLEVASLLLLMVRFRQPRPRWRRVWRQPGLLASAGAVVGMAIGLVGTVASSLAVTTGFYPAGWPSLLGCFRGSLSCGAPGVVGAWLALGLSGRWRAERSALDRLGRLVGWLWLAEFVIAEILQAKWDSVIDNIWGWR